MFQGGIIIFIATAVLLWIFSPHIACNEYTYTVIVDGIIIILGMIVSLFGIIGALLLAVLGAAYITTLIVFFMHLGECSCCFKF